MRMNDGIFSARTTFRVAFACPVARRMRLLKRTLPLTAEVTKAVSVKVWVRGSKLLLEGSYLLSPMVALLRRENGIVVIVVVLSGRPDVEFCVGQADAV